MKDFDDAWGDPLPKKKGEGFFDSIDAWVEKDALEEDKSKEGTRLFDSGYSFRFIQNRNNKKYGAKNETIRSW